MKFLRRLSKEKGPDCATGGKGRRWYNEEMYDGVMFVDTTPNGELKRRVEKACRKNQTWVL